MRRRCSLRVEALEGRTTPSAMPHPPMPPAPVETIVILGPSLPAIVLPIEVPVSISESPSVPKSAPTAHPSAPMAPDASIPFSAIAAFVHDAASHAAIAPTAELANADTAARPAVAESFETSARFADAQPDDSNASAARFGVVADSIPGQFAFDWIGDTHAAFWQRLNAEPHPTAERGAERPSVPAVEVKEPSAPVVSPYQESKRAVSDEGSTLADTKPAVTVAAGVRSAAFGNAAMQDADFAPTTNAVGAEIRSAQPSRTQRWGTLFFGAMFAAGFAGDRARPRAKTTRGPPAFIAS